MLDHRVGARFRALRQRLRWRQHDLANRAGVSQHVVSLIERGRLEDVMLAKIRRVARELDADFPPQLRWRGGDLDRLMDEAHARLAGRIVDLLTGHGWECRLEVTYSVYGERGSIDVLAWHGATRTLLVVEVKTDIVSIEETLRKHDEKVRLAARIATEQLGWATGNAARLLVLPSLATARRRVERHGQVLSGAYPERGARLRTRLAAPAPGQWAGILFIENADVRSAVGRKRIRGSGPGRADSAD